MRIYLVKFCVENPSKPLFEMKRAISLSNDNGNRKWYKNLMIAMKIMQQQQGCTTIHKKLQVLCTFKL